MNGKCKHVKNPVGYIRDIKLNQFNRMYAISAKIVATRPITNDIKLELIMKRCSNKESPDTCEDYRPIRINHMCRLIEMKNMAWSPFMSTIKPTVNCPVSKGVFTVTNGTLDGDALAAFNLDGWYWKAVATLYDSVTNETLFCIYSEAQIVTA